jgi:hypothetical protein
MFKRNYTPTMMDGPVFRHVAGNTATTKGIEISSSRNALVISGFYEAKTEDQLNTFIREVRLTWQEHLSLKRGEMPEKETPNAGNATTTVRNTTSRTGNSR